MGSRLRSLSPAALPALLAALLAACSSSVPARGAPSARCWPAGSRTLVRDRSVRVYALRASGPLGGARYACLLASGSSVSLQSGHASAPQTLANFTLAGSVLAYSDFRFGVDSGCTAIIVLDVAHRRTLQSLQEVACTVDAGFIRLGTVTDLVVDAHGAAAWIASRGTNAARSYEVRRASPSGARALLDQGPGILPDSLRLGAGSWLSWQHGTSRRSALL